MDGDRKDGDPRTTTAGGDATPLRERKKQQTARRIHAVALRLALRRGVPEVTVKEICEAAEVSPRTFFNYFPSKPAAVIGIPSLEIGQAQRERFLDGTGTVLDDLCILAADTLESSGLIPDDHRQVKRLLTADPELAYEMSSMLRSYREQLRELAAQRTDPETAHLAMALVFTAMPFCYRASEETPLLDRLHETLGTMRRLLDRS